MFQGGELHLQCGCGGFDSHLVHVDRDEGSTPSRWPFESLAGSSTVERGPCSCRSMVGHTLGTGETRVRLPPGAPRCSSTGRALRESLFPRLALAERNRCSTPSTDHRWCPERGEMRVRAPSLRSWVRRLTGYGTCLRNRNNGGSNPSGPATSAATYGCDPALRRLVSGFNSLWRYHVLDARKERAPAS